MLRRVLRDQITFFSFFDILPLLFSYSGARDSGLGRKSAVGRAQAGPLPPLWGLGPGPGPQNAKIIGKGYQINKLMMRLCNSTLFSYLFHISFVLLSHFWARSRSRSQFSYTLHILRYICESVVLHYFHTCNLWNGHPHGWVGIEHMIPDDQKHF